MRFELRIYYGGSWFHIPEIPISISSLRWWWQTLNAKLRACWGKYRMTLAKFPLQKLVTPSCAYVLATQSLTPLKLFSRRPCLSNSPWFCNNNFTLSIGAALVFAPAAAIPDNTKFSLKPSLVFDFEDDVDAMMSMVLLLLCSTMITDYEEQLSPLLLTSVCCSLKNKMNPTSVSNHQR